MNKDGYYIKVFSYVASVGLTADIEGIEAYDTNEKIFVSSDFLKSLRMRRRTKNDKNSRRQYVAKIAFG